MAVPLAIAAAALFAVCAALVAWGFARSLGVGRERAHTPALVIAGYFVVVSILTAVIETPLFVQCLAVWLALALVFCAASKRLGRGLFAANLVFICIAVSQMLTMAIVASFIDNTVWRLNADDVLRPATQAAGSALFCLVGGAFYRVLLKHFPLGEADGKSYSVLYGFSWFSLAYILFDALPSLNRLDLPLLTEFLLFSMLLLGVSLVAFVVATSLLGRDAQMEEEYLMLIERRDRQEARLDELRTQAYRDALTGLISRRGGAKVVENLLAQKHPFAIAYIDMNNLKEVNDTYGHEAGDACLVKLAEVLSASFPHHATVCRMSGDEFLVVLERGGASALKQGIGAARDKLSAQPLERVGIVSFSAGIVETSAKAGESVTDFIGRADRVMYEHKRAFHATSETSEGGA